MADNINPDDVNDILKGLGAGGPDSNGNNEIKPNSNDKYESEPDLDLDTLANYEKKYQEYRDAIKQEYAQNEERAKSLDESVDNAVEYFRKNMQSALGNIVFLMENSTSDGVRLNAAKYIIDRVYRGNVDSPGDPVGDILRGLKDNPKEAGSLTNGKDK